MRSQQARRRPERNASMIAFRMLQSMSRDLPVKVVLRHDAGTHEGIVVRWWEDPSRRPLPATRTRKAVRPNSSPLVFVFADGYEVAVNSIERVLGPKTGDES